MSGVAVRAMTADDWPAVEAIYREGIAAGHATFEAEPPSWEAFDSGKLALGRLVAVDDGAVLGWVAASPVSSRAVDRRVVEHSVYVAGTARGRGVGTLLLDAFLRAAGAAGTWTVQSSIFPENVASLAPPRGRRLPAGRPPGAHRAHDVRPDGGRVARHGPRRAQAGRLSATGPAARAP